MLTEGHIRMPHLDFRRILGRTLKEHNLRNIIDRAIGWVCLEWTEERSDIALLAGFELLTAKKEHLMLI